ncbi:class I SAM-dependent methyltransferase [Maricaulis maris]|uniref:Ubiquinone/menaquinone biosynthesis C-methylase UbiE n=1 Tax=Maricaulis maris TaxID=74318 RepID=A0A495DJW6_9PROT|nr:class I SAM-dependent methyltransferase [Maricaulis maris]RKR02862.1 ubiquinone/menaquinone biosynthesis C-methylase UbiE [Maricaulis maris]
MTQAHRWWDKIAEKYSTQPIADIPGWEHKLDRIRSHLTPDTRMLEFGCGTGGNARRLAPHAGSILATDLSGEMLRIAKARGDEEGLTNISYERGDFLELDLPAGQFDMVLGMSILHLLDDRHAAMAKARQLLKPGGLFITSTACLLDGFWFMVPILPIGRMLGAFPPVKAFGAKTLKREIADAGFEIEYEWRAKPSAALFIVARKPAG